MNRSITPSFCIDAPILFDRCHEFYPLGVFPNGDNNDDDDDDGDNNDDDDDSDNNDDNNADNDGTKWMCDLFRNYYKQ